MKILSIETSCDETAIAIIECRGEFENPSFKILGNSLLSQIEIHKEYGGVFPSLAKREHAKNLVPLLENTLKQSNLYLALRAPSKISDEKIKEIDLSAQMEKILEREPELFENLKELLSKIETPKIDAIAVTYGPGLEPALWVGLNFAKALSMVWNKPLIPINHMEGHICSTLSLEKNTKIEFPAIALLISGGHTELVLIKDWLDYEIIGQTKDDAVGEAFDKVARMLGLPYPGGPQISALAEITRTKNADLTQTNADNKFQHKSEFSFPRPMINTDDFDFSFSGLKTSVLYKLQKIKKTRKQENKEEITDEIKKEIAREFEDAVVDVLVSKTKKALQKYNAKTLIIGGGVVANKQIRLAFSNLETGFPSENKFKLLLPDNSLSTDNAIMIGIAGYFRFISNKKTRNSSELRAEGNLRL